MKGERGDQVVVVVSSGLSLSVSASKVREGLNEEEEEVVVGEEEEA
jgi:hypothetical protein